GAPRRVYAPGAGAGQSRAPRVDARSKAPVLLPLLRRALPRRRTVDRLLRRPPARPAAASRVRASVAGGHGIPRLRHRDPRAVRSARAGALAAARLSRRRRQLRPSLAEVPR